MNLSRQQRTAVTVDALFTEAIHASAALVANLNRGRDTRQCFSQLEVVLQSLPLTQAEYGWLTCRVANAAEYVARDERHAAAWEIRQLNRRLVLLNHVGTNFGTERRP